MTEFVFYCNFYSMIMKFIQCQLIYNTLIMMLTLGMPAPVVKMTIANILYVTLQRIIYLTRTRRVHTSANGEIFSTSQ